MAGLPCQVSWLLRNSREPHHDEARRDKPQEAHQQPLPTTAGDEIEAGQDDALCRDAARHFVGDQFFALGLARAQAGFVFLARTGSVTVGSSGNLLLNTIAAVVVVGLVVAVLPMVLAALPMFSNLNAVGVGLGGTSILIVVSVVVETMKQLEAQLMMRSYEGFIR